MKFGKAEVTRVEEYHGLGFPPAQFLPDWSDEKVAEHLEWLVPGHFSPENGLLVGSNHSWLIRLPNLTVLVDACSGSHKLRPHSPFFSMLDLPYMENLAKTGVKPEEIDIVLCTHLHLDHIGWNTHLVDGRWVPTFPNAKYVVSKTEFELLMEVEAQDGDNPNIIEDTIRPIIDSGQWLVIEGEYQLSEELFIEPSPGHTPGHVRLRLKASDGDALFTGDIIHYPIQLYFPEWNSFACRDADEARLTRRKLLEECSETSTVLLPAHFAHPHTCRVGKRVGEGFECILGR